MRIAPVLLAALMLLASGASASWKAVGGMEPSTRWDRDGPLMYADPDVAPLGAHLYFQAFQSVEQLTFNPNVAAADGRVLWPGAAHHRALLGAWKDCNGDGYVGHAESALQDYPSTLLSNTDACRPGGMFNDGRWVSEMIGVGMVDPCEYPRSDGTRSPLCETIPAFHANERVSYANGTMVWGDLGEPGSVPTAECPSAPLPPGTTSGTGGLLQYLDCQDGRRVATSVNALDPDGSRGLRFEDADHPERSSSSLNIPFPVTLFGGPQGPGLLEAGSGSSAARAWDCDHPRETSVDDPTGGGLSSVVLRDPTGNALTGRQPPAPVVGSVTLFEDHDGNANTPGQRRVDLAEGGSYLWVPAPALEPHDPMRSWWDAAEDAADGPRGDCDPKTMSPLRPAAPGPIVEGGAPPIDEARKDRTSLAFTFYDGHRGINERIDFLFGPTAPSDLGLLVRRHDRGGAGPMWSADAPTLQEPQLVTRGSLDPTGRVHWTYYAKIGSDALARGLRAPGGTTTLVYGKETCQGGTEERTGWVCDPTRWWLDALGRDVRPRYLEGAPYAPVPGDRYHMRDVDCYDGHLATGTYASLAPFTDAIC